MYAYIIHKNRNEILACLVMQNKKRKATCQVNKIFFADKRRAIINELTNMHIKGRQTFNILSNTTILLIQIIIYTLQTNNEMLFLNSNNSHLFLFFQ